MHSDIAEHVCDLRGPNPMLYMAYLPSMGTEYLMPIQEELRYDLTDTPGVLENKILSMFHGLDDYSVLVEGFPMQFFVQIGLKIEPGIARC